MLTPDLWASLTDGHAPTLHVIDSEVVSLNDQTAAIVLLVQSSDPANVPPFHMLFHLHPGVLLELAEQANLCVAHLAAQHHEED